MKKLTRWLLALIILGVIGFFVLTSPITWSLTHPTRDVADESSPDLENGRVVFVASDCATCHATPNQENHLKLGGGRALDTEFGRFYMPNISPDKKDGIGNWTLAQFTKAVREGVGPNGIMPDGQNLYPAFPYTSYQRLTANDVRDMFAYIQSLEPVAGQAPGHELKFPFTMRRGVGVWRLAFLDGQPLAPEKNTASDKADAILIERGRYLVEGAGHCAECHSTRNFMGVIKSDLRYGGGPTPDGKGHFPNISQDETGIKFWPENSIVSYLKTGKSPINKIAGGDMAEVIENTKQLPDADLRAMAAYLKTIPGVDLPAPGQPEPNRTPQIVMLKQTSKVNAVLPTSSDNEVAQADILYTVNTKPFYLDENGNGDEDGKLLATAKLTVVDRKGDKIKVRLDGWQMDGAPSVVYALKGQRIMYAVLGDKAIAAYSRGAADIDAETNQTWYPVNLELWTTNQGLNTSLSNMWAYSSDMFNSSCGVCHALPQADHLLANQWIGNLNAMKRYTSLTPDQYRLLLGYLQNHSKDVNESGSTH
ncbi:c-type cytochrome [Bartonella sp. HY406]|uniref:c-type cytochrome n=1 Tax=Bartonella sp. HY406 TaxID=2979331 RepID=UPI00290565D6|nr:c-type cytochrome [Bartonella sp. HY406]